MAFVVTYKNTKQVSDAPDFDAWVSTILDPDVVYAEYPDLSGVSMPDIVSDQVSELIDNVSQGFVSQESTVSDDDTVWTLVTTWESQADYNLSHNKGQYVDYDNDDTPGNITTSNVSTTVVGINTYFTSNLKVGQEIGVPVFAANVDTAIVGTVSSIESDTSLTLTANANLSVEDRAYFKSFSKKTALAFIQDLYNATYPVTTETTFANI